MIAPRKSVLVAGLGRFGPSFFSQDTKGTHGNTESLVDADMKKANELGFDCTAIYLDPKDLTGALSMVKDALGSRPWDLFVIGYGVRGTKSLTPLFEAAVNASREIAPSTNLAFSIAPDALYDTILRTFPEAK